MKVLLHDSDSTNFPNLTLMKLSASHKKSGDDVSWFEPMFYQKGDRVYSSKVFTFTPEDPYLPEECIKGGTGYESRLILDDSIEHTCPDYDLYNMDYSLGFLTRGCNNKCPWCFVPEKEGKLKANADIKEFLRHKDVVLMDNNVLGSDHGISQIEKMAKMGIRVDFNQGLDARLIDDGIARRLAALKWLAPIRLSCDTISQIKPIQKAVELLRWHNATPRRYYVNVLVKDIPDAIERVKFLKGMDLDPFAQPYRDKEGTEPTKDQKRFARWCNHKAIFKSNTWGEYNR